MSPEAKLPVEDNGGLSVAQIDLRIAASERQTARLWAGAMEEHIKKIDERFDLHEKKDALRIEKQELALKNRLDIQDDFVDTRMTAQDEKLDKILAVVTTNRERGEQWHVEDLEYRATIQEWRDNQEPTITNLAASVKTVQDQQLDISTKFNLIQWLVLFCRGISWTSGTVVDAAEKGRKIYSAVAAICSSLLFIWAFFRDGGILEAIKKAVQAHH